MNILALDTETPKFDDKEPWRGKAYSDFENGIVCVSLADGHDNDPDGMALKWEDTGAEWVQKTMSHYDLVVFFNGKHDISWLRREGVDFSNVRIWDCQLAEFVISRQLTKFPSLDDCCRKYGIERKLDIVKTEYWDKGVDTKDVPWPILEEYASHDAAITLQCYHAQLPHLTDRQRRLVSLMSQDLLVLEEMERNGIAFNEELCKVKEQELDKEISTITEKLTAIYPSVPINFGSPKQLSAVLFGGTIVETVKEQVGYYKSGAKKGQPSFRNREVEHVLPRLFQPSKETATEGVYETNEGAIRKLKGISKGHNWLAPELLRLAKLDKLNGTYYKGLPKLREEMKWAPGKVHGQLNQTLATTGRLSSSKPNTQNFASELQDIFISEYS